MPNDEILTVKETVALLKPRASNSQDDRQRRTPGLLRESCLTHKIGVISAPICALPPFTRRIFHCFRPALPAFFGFWVKSGSKRIL